SHALRESLPASTGLGVADIIALAALEARDALHQPKLYAALQRVNGFHVGILGWGETAIELAAAALQGLWAPEKHPPRVTIFCEDAPRAEAEFYARFDGFAEAMAEYWKGEPDAGRPTIRFVAYDGATSKDPWSPMLQAAPDLCVLAIANDDPNERLHAAAKLISRRGARNEILLFVRGTPDGAAELVLAPSDPRVAFFGGPRRILTAEMLISPALDRASEFVHNSYLETRVLAQHRGIYLDTLQRGGVNRGAWRAATNEGVTEERIEAAEASFSSARGRLAFLRLREKLARQLLHEGLFTPDPGRPAQTPWHELSESYVLGSRAQVDHALLKLAVMGYTPPEVGGRRTIVAPPNDVSAAQCECEHDRWATQMFLTGWRLGAERIDAQKLHTDLIRYGAFPAEKKAEAVKKDRDPWFKAPEIAAMAYPHWFAFKP
ncbi:MAG: hypothetical protein ABUS57_05150, partial [Pseudomonadota bacterium]